MAQSQFVEGCRSVYAGVCPAAKRIPNGSVVSRTSRFDLPRRIHRRIALFFYDPERPKIGSRVFLTYSNVGGVQKLHWELTIMGYQPILPGEPTPQLDFRVPTNCELIKQ